MHPLRRALFRANLYKKLAPLGATRYGKINDTESKNYNMKYWNQQEIILKYP